MVALFGSAILPAAAQGNQPPASPALRNARPLHGRGASAAARSARATIAGDPGDDDTAISLDPTLSALCQSFIGGVNPYANPAPNVDQINGDAKVLAGTQTGCSTPQNETSIAVNPKNPRNLVGGANDYRVFNTREGRNDGSGWAYTTFDGGKTWTNMALPHLTFQTGATGLLSNMDSAGDPALAFGPKNTVYYANITFSRLNNGNAITVNASRDGGKTWGEPVIVQADGVDNAGNPLPTPFFNDKEWIGVDQETGVVYVTWTRFGPEGSPIVVSSSRDGGKTWSPFVTVNPASAFTTGGVTPFSQGSIPQIGKKGELYIAYEAAVCQSLNCDQPTDHDAIIMAKSTDGGKTFKNTEAAINFDFPFNPDVGRSTLTGENFRINSFPQFTIDPDSGRLYVVWADDRNGQYGPLGNSIKTNGDAFLITSKDGVKWSKVFQLGTSADEVYPAVAAYDGHIAVTFYTRAYDPNGIGLDYAYVNASGPGNIKKNRVIRITTQTSNPQIQFVGVGAVTGKELQGVFIGDYTAVAMGEDLVLHPSWTDFRGNPGLTLPNQEAYTQAIPMPDKGKKMDEISAP
jgi:hypothetical protein